MHSFFGTGLVLDNLSFLFEGGVEYNRKEGPKNVFK
jgi:hypothetical protein